MKKINRKQLRSILEEEYTKIVESYGSEMSPDDPDYDTCGECIMQCTRKLRSTNIPTFIKMGHGHMVLNDVKAICQDICDAHGVGQHCDYVTDKVMALLERM